MGSWWFNWKTLSLNGGFTTGFIWGGLVSTLLLWMSVIRYSTQGTGSYAGCSAGVYFRESSVDMVGRKFSRAAQDDGSCNAGESNCILQMESRTGEKFGRKAFENAHQSMVPLGTSSFLFIHYRSYRVGPATFAIVGLGPKQMYMALDKHPTDHRSGFKCSWVSNAPLDRNAQREAVGNHKTLSNAEGDTVIFNGTALKYSFEDLSYGNGVDYSGLVVYCNFDGPVGVDGNGGELAVVAEQGERGAMAGLSDVKFAAMEERPGEYNASAWEEPLPYEYLYCSGPLYGNINPQRIREWMAYHMRLFGESAFFILYDVGGLKAEHWEVLQPWIKLGRVSVIPAQEQARYSVHVYNQFMLTNDCLLRGKRIARWLFHFDMDEYIYVTDDPEAEGSFHRVMKEMRKRGRNATSVELLQIPMSREYCSRPSSPVTNYSDQSKWAIENFLFRRKPLPTFSGYNSSYTPWKDRKSAYQTKYVQILGVHRADHVDVPEGLTKRDTTTVLDQEGCENCAGNMMHYYHYSGMTAVTGGDLCPHYVASGNTTTFEHDSAEYTFDDTMVPMVDHAKTFELKKIGAT